MLLDFRMNFLDLTDRNTSLHINHLVVFTVFLHDNLLFKFLFHQDTSFLKQPHLGCDGSVFENDDEDDNDDSIGGLGRRIRKLSSRTIEFCDSIDNIQVKIFLK